MNDETVLNQFPSNFGQTLVLSSTVCNAIFSFALCYCTADIRRPSVQTRFPEGMGWGLYQSC